MGQNIATYVNIMALFLMALGAVISIIAFFGCCGAIRQSRCCLGVFFGLLLLCFLVTILFGGFLLFVAATGKSGDDVSSTVREAFQEMVKIIWQAMSETGRTNFERAHSCCGIDSSIGSLAGNIQCAITTTPTTQNCSSKLIEQVQGRFFLAGAVIMGIAVIEVVGMAMACFLFTRYRHVYTAV